MMYFQLFLSFIKVGLFSIGGGYAAVPIIQSQVIDHYGWLDIGEFTDLVSIAEMTPGPIALNAATFVGQRVLGLPGALIATAACVIPSLIIVTLLFFLYNKYGKLSGIQKVLSFLRPAVIAFIASAGLTILLNVLSFSGFSSLGSIDITAAVLFVAAFISLRKLKLNPILVMASCGAVYTLIHIIFR